MLKEQLQELQTALLASILDMEEYQKGCASCTGPTSPLDWTDGLLLLHSCPPPLDQHLLRLLGPSAVSVLLCLLPPPLSPKGLGTVLSFVSEVQSCEKQSEEDEPERYWSAAAFLQVKPAEPVQNQCLISC